MRFVFDSFIIECADGLQKNAACRFLLFVGLLGQRQADAREDVPAVLLLDGKPALLPVQDA